MTVRKRMIERLLPFIGSISLLISLIITQIALYRSNERLKESQLTIQIADLTITDLRQLIKDYHKLAKDCLSELEKEKKQNSSAQ